MWPRADAESKGVLGRVVDRYRGKGYEELLGLLDHPVWHKASGPSGRQYGVKVYAYWDGVEYGPLRVFFDIDHGGWSFWFPRSVSFIVAAGETLRD